MSIKIHLGSGCRPLAGYVNVDINASNMPDVVHDLTQYPWPFADNSADEIVCVHVLEHLIHQGNANEFFAFFRECWRVLEHGGVLRIVVPDAAGGWAFSDPWHTCAFNKEIFSFISKHSIKSNADSNTRMTPVEIDFDFNLHALNTVNSDIHLEARAVKA